MKKSLLSLAAVASMAFAGYAHEASVTFSALGYENAAELTEVKVNDDITLTFDGGGNSNTPKYYNTGKAARLYGDNTVTVTGATGVTITDIKFTTGTGDYVFNAESTASEPTFNVSDAEWTGSANAVTFTQGGKKGHVRISAISFTYTGGTGTGGTETPTPPEPTVTEVANIQAFISTGVKGTTYKFTNPVNVAYQNGTRLYVEDATGSLLIFGTANQTYKNGDVIPAGFTGGYDNYYGIIEFTNPEGLQAATETTTVAPELLTMEELSADMVSKYVKVEGVEITQEGSNFYGTDETGVKIQLYNRFKIEIPAEVTNMTVVGTVSVYNNLPQIEPIEITDAGGVVVEVCKTPAINPASGEVAEGTLVSISCETEGAEIHYTVDGSEPTADSPVYTEEFPINADMTVQAIAMKEGMENSSIAVAEYTIKANADNVASFLFNNPSTLNPSLLPDFATVQLEVEAGSEQYFADNANYYFKATDVPFSNGNVTVTVTTDYTADDGSAKNATDGRVYYQSGGAIQLRAYKNATITIASVDPQNLITAIKFGFNNTSSAGQFSPALTDGEWSAAEGAASVKFTLAGTVQINTIDVTCQNKLSGVENVAEENTDAPVEYYNLQGVRVINPENGLYIRRQGNNVTKVIIR